LFEQESGGAHIYQRALCQLCGLCVDACLYEALKLAGRPTSVEAVLAEVRKDISYYQKSGGGITLTGGEPMLQLDFTLALLQAAHREGIHTCQETCGWASRRAYERVLPWVDCFLFDYKATSPEEHRRLTGVDNDLILANLDFLYQRGATIRLRCPLVPGMNDNLAHLSTIAALDRRYPHLASIELPPYHNIGSVKYLRYQLSKPLPDLPSASAEQQQAWLTTLRNLGCEKSAIVEDWGARCSKDDPTNFRQQLNSRKTTTTELKG
jgi:glycyl-radical enzyme activating protein